MEIESVLSAKISLNKDVSWTSFEIFIVCMCSMSSTLTLTVTGDGAPLS